MTEKPARILIVDDEFSVRDSLYHWFQKEGYEVTAVAGAAEAFKALEEHRYDVALLDVKLGGMDGLELQEHIHRLAPQTAVIIITAFASVETAVRALKDGAFDYLTKPIDPDELSHLVRRAVEHRRLREENLQLRGAIDELVTLDPIVGQSPPMRKVMELVEHVAKTDATVLILGESGTGKELIARAIHAKSKRRYSPLVPVNCGTLPETLLASELFGYEKGAFTGADCRHKGKIEAAEGGTLFLDEVGAVNVNMQVDLLRVLEAKELTRVGGTQPVKVDFRVICATNDNLEIAVAEGRFREDLYYRINVFTIPLPPLRDRRSDIFAAGLPLSPSLCQADGQTHQRHQPCGHEPADGPRLAGQRARAVQRHRTGDGRGPPARRPARGSAAAGVDQEATDVRRVPGGDGETAHCRGPRSHRRERDPRRRDPQDRPGHRVQQDQEVRPAPLALVASGAGSRRWRAGRQTATIKAPVT